MYQTLAQMKAKEMAKEVGEKSGGKVNYYLVNVDHPRRDDQPAYQAECEDIISALGMTFDEGCAFKALWRSAAARKGIRKAGHDPIYDAEKMVHYSGNVLRTLRLELEDIDLSDLDTQIDLSGSLEHP